MKRNEELWNKLFEHKVALMYESAMRESSNVRERHAVIGTLHGSPFATEVTNFLIYEPFSKIRDYFTEAYLQPYAAASILTVDDKKWLQRKLDDVYREQLLRAKGMIQQLCLDCARIYPKDIQPQLSDFEIRAGREIRQTLLRESEIIFLMKGARENDSEVALPTLLQLPNRDGLLVDLDELLKKSCVFSVVFADLDNFKQVNDTLGHPAGDQCLEAVVAIMGSAVAGKGRLYRYGGDEFVAVLPNYESSEAVATGERIRKSIDDENPGGKVKITASIGVVSSDQLQMPDPKTLIAAADQAMYSAKKSGKNQVTVWKEQEPSVVVESKEQKWQNRKAELLKRNPSLDINSLIIYRAKFERDQKKSEELRSWR
ncbi:MAG: GGDEF domain-containing protein [Acidobacteria bacterium]|nr:GGDEF domain-containing protein [Acidobacteriota bacterium]